MGKTSTLGWTDELTKRSVAVPGHSIVRVDEGSGRKQCLLHVGRCCARGRALSASILVEAPALELNALDALNAVQSHHQLRR
jgi:hypothetical protein